VKNRICLSHGVQVVGATWWATMRIVTGVGDLVQRTGDGRTYRVLSGRTIGRLGDAICGLHRACGDEERGFLGFAQNQGRQFVTGLVSKPLGWFSLVWPQNRWRRFLLVWPQNRWLGFSGLGLKIDSYDLMIWTSKSLRRFLGLGLKTKHASVCRLRLKPDGRMRRRGTCIEI
jgi:hypothetical protein